MRMLSYKNKEAINEGFDSGQVFPSAKYNVNNGDLVIVVANDDENNLIEGYVIEKTHDVPNYIAKRIFKSSREKGNVNPSSYDGWGGKPKRRFTIHNQQFSMIEGGKVKVVDGSQKRILEFLGL
jgi:hypothetical protein